MHGKDAARFFPVLREHEDSAARKRDAYRDKGVRWLGGDVERAVLVRDKSIAYQGYFKRSARSHGYNLSVFDHRPFYQVPGRRTFFYKRRDRTFCQYHLLGV